MRRRGWLSREQFLDYVGAANLIPGPNSTELAIYIGHARAGWTGLLAAGISFIVPAVLIVSVAAWAYVRYGTLPEAEGLLYGIKPVAIAIVAQALWSLGRAAVKTVALAVLALAGIVAAAAGVHELAGPRMFGCCGGIDWTRREHQPARETSAHDWRCRWRMRCDCRRDRFRGSRGPVRALAVVLGLCQDRFGPVRKRLRAFRVSPRGPRRTARVAHRAATDRCDCDRPGHARPGLHDRDVHRLCPRVVPWAPPWPRSGSSCRRSCSWR